MSLAARRLRVHGVVQGVGFRWFVMRQARRLELVGWVRNRDDGTVEAWFAGSDEAVAALIASCRRGPANAYVRQLEVELADPAEAAQYSGFEQRPTV